MTKKDYLIKLLSALENDREIAWGLKLMIEKSLLSPEIIDGLQHIFAKTIATINDAAQQQKLEKWLDILSKLKEKEQSQQDLDQKDLETLDSLLQNI